VWGKGTARKEKWTPQKNWWYFRTPMSSNAQLEDELARSRKREAFWISVIIHIIVVLLIIFSPQLLPDWAKPHLLRAADLKQNSTFVTLPDDLQKPPEKVQTDKLSDKNRIAQIRRPQIDNKTLNELRGNMRSPGPAAPRRDRRHQR
jgi:hypothetical protein